VFTIAAETGWSEERIMFMPLARLAQYQHCLLRRNGISTRWSNHVQGGPEISLKDRLAILRTQWNPKDDATPHA
jgi:hypothetical protein